MATKRTNPYLSTWERNAKLRDDTYDKDGYHGERDTTLVPLGSNPMKDMSVYDAARALYTIIFQEALKVNFAGNVASWRQVPVSVKSGTVTVFEVETRRPGYGAMLALAPTITYRQRSVTYSIGQYRMSLPFDQFVIEYNDAQALSLLALGQQQIFKIFDANMTNFVLAAMRSAYMGQFDTPIDWLEETLEYGAVLNQRGFDGTELVSLFKNIQPNANSRLLLATSETGFMAMNLPPVTAANTPGISSVPMDPSAVVSILTRSLQAQGSRRTVDNIDIYGIPHYSNEANANLLQSADNIDSNVFVHGVILNANIPAGTDYLLVPSLTGLWYKLAVNDTKGKMMFTEKPFKIRGSDLLAGPLGGKPLFTGDYWPTRSIRGFEAHNGDANILTMTGWGGTVTLPDQISIGAAAFVLTVECKSKNKYAHSTAEQNVLDYAENRSKLFDMSNMSGFSDAKTHVAEWKEAIESNSIEGNVDYGVGALIPFIAVSKDAAKPRVWIKGHPLFERLAVSPHTSMINKTLSKVIPTFAEFVPTMNTISASADVEVS